MVSYYPIAGLSYSPARQPSQRVWLDCVAKQLYATKTCLCSHSLSALISTFILLTTALIFEILQSCLPLISICQCSSCHHLRVLSSIHSYLQTDSSIPKTPSPFIATNPSVVTFNTFIRSLHSPIPRSPSPAIPSLLAPNSPSHSLQASDTTHHFPYSAP